MKWSERRVLVTDADGFIGSHLTEALVEAGAAVRPLCFYNSQGSLGWLDTVAPDVRGALDVRLGDIQGTTHVRRDSIRSEEHTSELQSLAYLVCRLLLEKKKTIKRY